jgi:hypothetical protein
MIAEIDSIASHPKTHFLDGKNVDVSPKTRTKEKML